MQDLTKRDRRLATRLPLTWYSINPKSNITFHAGNEIKINAGLTEEGILGVGYHRAVLRVLTVEVQLCCSQTGHFPSFREAVQSVG